METVRLRNGTAGQFLGGIGSMFLRFLGGMGTMLLASIVSGFVGGYLISLFRVGPYPPWVPIDKNIGLESAFYGIIAGTWPRQGWLGSPIAVVTLYRFAEVSPFLHRSSPLPFRNASPILE